MLFKPWSEFERAPRHTLDLDAANDEFDDGDKLTALRNQQQRAALQNVKFELNDEKNALTDKIKSNALILLPYNLKFLVDSLPVKSTTVATISISNGALSDIDTNRTDLNDEELEFLEDQQLYSAISTSESFKPFEIDIVSYLDLNINAVVVPNLFNSHPIVNHQLSRYLLRTLSPSFILLLTPCALNYNESVCKLVNFSPGDESSQEAVSYLTKIQKVPSLSPPHFISGITAAVMSAATISNIKAVNLILDSEGSLNFERISNDSIVSVVRPVAQFFGFSDEDLAKYRKAVSKKSSINDYITSGMYI